MLQAYKLSCSSNPKNHRREQGILISNWQQVRQVKLRNRNEMKKSLTCYCEKTSASADKFGRNDSMSNRKQPAQKIKCVSTLGHGFMSQPKDGNSMDVFLSYLWMHLETFYRFTRPHTIIGTIFGITSISLLPLSSLGELSPTFFVGILKVLLPIMFMNIYVVGLNQLFDVEIDKVNKPELPLASGEYTMELGKAIVFAFGFMSFAMGILFQSPPLFPSLVVCFVFGSVYSVELPFLRWKRNGFLAAACILIVRAVTVQLVTFIHIQTHVLGRPLVFTRSLGFALGFMTIFTAVIALFKDIPDVDGDRDFGINSFTVRLGKKRVFWFCISMLLVAYGSAVAIGASSSILLSKLVTIVGHTTLASVVLLKAQSVNLDDNKSIYSFYMFIWKLFYAEYLLIPFVR